MQTILRTISVLVLTALSLLAGCGKDRKPPTIVLISPNPEDIRREFERAFKQWHQEKFSEEVALEWRDVGGGSNQILEYLRNRAAGGATGEIDILWGGGENNFMKAADQNLLAPMTLAADVTENIPLRLSGVPLRDEKGLWCGTAISGFGMIYNKTLLQRGNAPEPATWDDLAKPPYFDMVSLADPTQSGTAAAAFEMVALSEKDWPAGWAKCLAICGNAKKFFDSAGASANAPALGESAIATCIDFYGTNRVAKNPDKLVYVSPKGQTTFSPDPIAIIRGAPHPELAQRFVDFVLSAKGQALFALKKGEADGPTEAVLGRQPVRKDVYTLYAGKMVPSIINPYEAGAAMEVDSKFRKTLSTPLQKLIKAAAIDNMKQLHEARSALIASGMDAGKLAEFNRLPDNVATPEKLAEVSAILNASGDPAAIEKITSAWQQFFRDKYAKVAAK